ncbi:MAG: hypothetical protein LBI64_02215 [Coriobacteriales bacterium]|jgi:hypothetical protein|nr:hypothetical protein [Coriobacteriales bacterium]
MKRIVVRLTALSIIMALTLTLTSCSGGLSGTYYAYDEVSATFYGEKIDSITFESFGEAEMRTYGPAGLTTWKDCTYTLSNGGSSITILAEWNYTDRHEETYSFSRSSDTIFIDGREFGTLRGVGSGPIPS